MLITTNLRLLHIRSERGIGTDRVSFWNRWLPCLYFPSRSLLMDFILCYFLAWQCFLARIISVSVVAIAHILHPTCLSPVLVSRLHHLLQPLSIQVLLLLTHHHHSCIFHRLCRIQVHIVTVTHLRCNLTFLKLLLSHICQTPLKVTRIAVGQHGLIVRNTAILGQLVRTFILDMHWIHLSGQIRNGDAWVQMCIDI